MAYAPIFKGQRGNARLQAADGWTSGPGLRIGVTFTWPWSDEVQVIVEDVTAGEPLPVDTFEDLFPK